MNRIFSQKGFTLTELLISIACLGLLTAGTLQAVQYLNFTQTNIDLKTSQLEQINLLKANLDNTLRNTSRFFTAGTIPLAVRNNTTLDSDFTLPVPTDDPDNAVAGNTLFFTTSELVDIGQLRPQWAGSGRLAITTLHCIYLKRNESDPDNPGAFQLIHYSDRGFISRASTASFYLWTQGQSPNNNLTADQNSLNTFLTGLGYTFWDPTAVNPPAPTSFSKQRVLYSYLGRDVRNQSSDIDQDLADSPPPPMYITVVRNVASIHLEGSMYSVKAKHAYPISKKVDILTRKIRLE